MTNLGDNPYDDGLDFVGCPPIPTRLKLPKFPENLKGNCKLICWARCMPVADGERMMTVVLEEFGPDPKKCGVYNGKVHFIDRATGDEWYNGELKFHYTRNYNYSSTSIFGERYNSIAFRFVAKGDIVRVSNKMPEWECLILCTKRSDEIKEYKKIFVYGGLDVLLDVKERKTNGFMLNLGHNDGWYTHHPKCSKRPIDWNGYGDYIGHYCDRGWVFVSPGKNFVFDPTVKPPTGRFFEEAIRETGKDCYTENAIRYGALDIKHIRCIHSYQLLKGITECKTSLNSRKFCQGLVYSNEKHPWVTFFSMGYWVDGSRRKRHYLHLAEGNIQVDLEKYKKYKKGLYFYGFATRTPDEDLKLVDLASNKDAIGAPAETDLVLYLFNAGITKVNPKLRMPLSINPKLAAKLLRGEMNVTKDKDMCQFLVED